MRAIELQTANIKLKNDYDSELKKNVIIIPTFADVHVHLREPGFFYKETIRTGTMAAARSGYGLLMSMPNLQPVPDCLANLEQELKIIKKEACIDVIPYGSITKGEKGQENRRVGQN